MKKFIAFCLIFVLLLTGCQQNRSGPVTPEPAQAGGHVIVALDPASEPAAGFDPAFGWGAGEHVHEPLIQSTLTVTNSDLTIGYDLATEMEVSEDGLLWTVQIREDVTFTDGEPLTASDVAFTYNTVRDAASVNDLTMLDYAEAQGNTVLFHMKRPFSIWPYTMATVGILPEHAYDPATYGANPIGSGRYMLKQWDRGQQIILQNNPDYYGQQPQMDRVTILFLEEDAAFLAVQAGQVDLAYTSAAYSQQSPVGYSLLPVKTVDNLGISLPTAGNIGASHRAISLGLDRQAILDRVLDGYGTPAYSVCDNMPWSSPTAGKVVFDRDQANALLDETGFLPGPDGIRERWSFGRMELTIHYPAGDTLRQAVAAELCSQLNELGIAAQSKGTDWQTIYQQTHTAAAVWDFGSHTPMELYNLYHSGGLYGYSSAYLDALMDYALACTDLESSYALWQTVQEEVADHGFLWLVNIDHLYWVRDGLQVAQQKIHPHGHGWSIVNNVDQWSWS